MREVGTGAASTVYYGVCRKSCLPCAIKMYNKSKLTRLNKHQVDREVNIHSSLKHPHIIDFVSVPCSQPCRRYPYDCMQLLMMDQIPSPACFS